ncbi:MAG: hypothetical protein RL885_14175 [Planctomycetota bacterium]
MTETALACPEVVRGDPILLVARTEDGLVVACGGSHSEGTDWVAVKVEPLLERDSTLQEALAIEGGQFAERDAVGTTWRQSNLEEPEPDVIACHHVLQGSAPVLLVCHDALGWQFLCGEPHEGDPPEASVVGLNHLLGQDPSLESITDLEEGFEAERPSTEGEWSRAPFEP